MPVLGVVSLLIFLTVWLIRRYKSYVHAQYMILEQSNNESESDEEGSLLPMTSRTGGVQQAHVDSDDDDDEIFSV